MANVSDDAQRIDRGDERTNSAGTPLTSLLILALALTAVGILSTGVIKIVAARRARIVTDGPVIRRTRTMIPSSTVGSVRPSRLKILLCRYAQHRGDNLRNAFLRATERAEKARR